ncbi:MAG: Fic family protein [Desulfosarcina sp.]|nr:Fic family protein [Desulfosarcina sp.]MBC2765340.1 Fic family protein [Desulfosarcina sp.]
MDKSRFSDGALGKLQKISIQEEWDYAFIPESLPGSWDIPQAVWPLLVEAREELARLDGVGRHMPNYDLLLRPLQQREAIRSSSLEGTYATPEQLLLFEIDPKEPKSHRDPVNSWKEVFNYGDALRLGQKLLTDLPISLRFIRELHKALMRGVRGFERDPGNFRRTQVHIGSDRRFIPPPANEVTESLNKKCSLTKPWLYLSSYFDKYKDEYIDKLFKVSAHGDWENWISFCLRGTIVASKDAIVRFDALVKLRETYQNVIRASFRLSQIIEGLFKSPIITIPQVARIHNVSYPTARSDVEKMVEIGILKKSEMQRRPEVFFAEKILKSAYSDISDE